MASVPIEGRCVLVTGGAGFIGSHLVRLLAPANEVFVVDNLYRHAGWPSWLDRLPHARLLERDVRDPALPRLLPRGLTHILHLAAVAGVQTVRQGSVEAMRANLEGILRVVEIAEALPDLEHFVYFSSSEVYGSEALDVSEGHVSLRLRADEPRWTYAVAKLAGEVLLQQLWQERGLPMTIVRPFNVYGPGQLGEGAVREFVREALAGRPLRLRGSGEQRRAWCYVDDFVDGVSRLLGRRPLGEAFNLGNPDAVCCVRELAEAVQRATGSTSPLVTEPLAYEDVRERVPNVDKARALLGFSPRVGLREGLARTVAWHLEATSPEHAPPPHG